LKRGDIYFVSLDPCVGHEQRGHRPVIVLTDEIYNQLTNAPYIAPITNGGAFAKRNKFSIDLEGRGLKTSGIVRCDQIRALDLMTRSARYVEAASEELIEEILDKLTSILY